MEGYEVAKRRCAYNATRFLAMIQQHGAVDTARRLLDRANDVQYGFTEMWLCGATGKFPRGLDYTVEAIVWKPEFRVLFSEEELKVARKRLEDLKYRPAWVDW